MPPLRNRKEDILQLACFFLKKYASQYGKVGLSITASVIEKLESYPWPGNIRELQHTIEKAVILCDSNELLPSEFALDKEVSNVGLHKEVSGQLKQDVALTLEEAEYQLIALSMKRNNGNISAVAAELGISRPTLYSKINKYKLDL